jgi:hypothetical protein
MEALNLHDEFTAIVAAFKKRRVRFAVVGGLAMAFHDEPRFTRDIDLLLHSADEGKLADALAELGYFESARPWQFRDAPIVLRRFVKVRGEDFVPVDILVGRAPRIDAIVGRATAQKWMRGTVRVATKEDIIRLKRGRGSDQDKVDIKRLKK